MPETYPQVIDSNVVKPNTVIAFRSSAFQQYGITREDPEAPCAVKILEVVELAGVHIGPCLSVLGHLNSWRHP